MTKEIKKHIVFPIIGGVLVLALIVITAFYIQSNKKSKDKDKTIEAMSVANDEIASEKEELESKCEEESNAIVNLSSQIDTLTEKQTQSSTYDTLYPDVKVSDTEETKDVHKIVYLTFDDGPSELTPQFLEVLKEKGVNATFFVTYQPNLADTYKRIINEGNAIQVHTATHDYKKIYSSVENYLADFEQVYSFVSETTGMKPDCFRFPGGSTATYAKSTAKSIAQELNRRGFTFFDWNVSVGDGSALATKDSILEKIKNESSGKNKIVMLAHDSKTKTETLSALPEIIDYYKENGYSFGVINNTVDPSCAQFIKWRE